MSRRDWKRIVVGVALAVALVAMGLGAYGRAEHHAKLRRAEEQMQRLESAVKKYHMEHDFWPENNNLQLVAPYLDCGERIDHPWGGSFGLEIVRYQDETDGTFKERPVIICHTPTGEVLRYPETSR